MAPTSRSFIILVGALALIVSGCISTVPASTDGANAASAAAFPADWAARALAYGEGHDHTDPKQHASMTTPNFEVLGWDALSTDAFGGTTAGGYLCGEAQERDDGSRYAVVSSFTTDIAFVVADVTDAAHPVKVGEYVLSGVKTYDVALSPDGMHVLIAADSLGGNEDPTSTAVKLPVRSVQPQFRDACTGKIRNVGPEQQLPLEPGVVMVGIQDPANPTFEDFQVTPFLGPHSVSTSRIDGTQYVIASITNLAHAASYFNFYEIVDTPVGSRLVLLSTVDAQQYGAVQTGFAALGNGHVEATMSKHPVTGKPVAYLCDWDGGLILLDMSIPNAPVKLGEWADTQVEGGAMHSAYPIETTWNDRHYVIAGQEFLHRPVDRPTGWIYILDDTDPTNVVEVGRWTLPVDTDPEWGNNELFSTHYFAVVNTTLFVTMYHGGVWAVDLSDPETFAEPPTVGVFVPAFEPEKPPKVRWEGQIRSWPYVLDVIPYSDGTLVVWDSTSGIYTVKFDASMPVVSPTPWPAAGADHDDNG